MADKDSYSTTSSSSNDESDTTDSSEPWICMKASDFWAHLTEEDLVKTVEERARNGDELDESDEIVGVLHHKVKNGVIIGPRDRLPESAFQPYNNFFLVECVGRANPMWSTWDVLQNLNSSDRVINYLHDLRYRQTKHPAQELDEAFGPVGEHGAAIPPPTSRDPSVANSPKSTKASSVAGSPISARAPNVAQSPKFAEATSVADQPVAADSHDTTDNQSVGDDKGVVNDAIDNDNVAEHHSPRHANARSVSATPQHDPLAELEAIPENEPEAMLEDEPEDEPEAMVEDGPAAELDAIVKAEPEGEPEGEQRLCICEGAVQSDNLLACDNEACPIERFHFECVGLEKKPSKNRKWYCSQCKPTVASKGKAKAKTKATTKGVGKGKDKPKPVKAAGKENVKDGGKGKGKGRGKGNGKK